MTTDPVTRGRSRRHLRFIAGLAIALLAAAAVVPAQDAAAVLAKNRSIAAAQHEIVMLLIGKKDFTQALSEAERIFELNWPPDQEPVLLKELLLIAAKFLQEKQPALGLRLIERNSRLFRSKESRIAVLKEKGFLYKELGENDKALEAFREARTLESSGPTRN